MTMIPVLTTLRLQLRPFTITDADAVHALLQAPEIADTTLNITHPYPAGAAESWIASHGDVAENGSGWTWAIERRIDKVLLGTISLGITAEHRRGGIGYWIGVPFWNLGYATEAAQGVLDYAFGTLHLQRFESSCFPRNPASARVLEKIGLRYEGTRRGYVRKGGTFEDVMMFAILRDEHADVRNR